MKPILKFLYQNSRNKRIKELIFNVFNEDWYIRANIALSQNIPLFILEKLSNDKNANVRKYVASNSKAPIHILERLSDDENKIVRYCISDNRKVPVHILEKLSNDKEPEVRDFAIYNLKLRNYIKKSL